MNASVVSKSLMAVFLATVTTWYIVTPYIVQPHPGIARKLVSDSVLSRVSGKEDTGDGQIILENWTKWRIYVQGQNQVIDGSTAQSISFNESKMAVMNMAWRSDYDIVVEESNAKVTAKVISPLVRMGIYNHFELEVSGRTVRVVPRFLFGIPFKTVQSLYPPKESQDDVQEMSVNLPIIGIFSQSTKYDRIIIQAYMNLVTLSVVFLLWTNNPPATLMKALANTPGGEAAEARVQSAKSDGKKVKET